MDADAKSIVALKVQAMLSTIRTKDDPAKVFFDRFPTPKEMYSVMSSRAYDDMCQRLAIVLNTLNIFCDMYGQESEDQDFEYVMKVVIKGSLNVRTGFQAPMLDSMACLALKKSRNGGLSSQGTKKDQLLSYYLWRLHGQKDEACPISAQKSSKKKEGLGVSSHDFLPSSRTTRGPCSKCGHAQANSWCSGCCIVKSGNIVSATFYCDRSCMKAHWKVHKPACKEVRALRRAATIFTELWLGYLQLTDYRNIESVVEANSLIEIVCVYVNRRAFLGEGMFRPFPRHLVYSEEQALACMMVNTCEDIAEKGRVLFELVMRSCGVVEAVRVQPKNAHKAVYISYPSGQAEAPFLYFHLVFRLSLPSGLTFAFDPTGAQNGWQENLAPWDAYEQHRIHFIRNTRTLDAWGPEQRNRELERKILSSGELEVEIKLGQQFRLAYMAGVVDGYLKLKLPGKGMGELLHRLSDDRFEAVKKSLVNTAMENLRRYQREIDTGPTEKLYLDSDFQVYLTQTSKQFHSLQKVWFAEAEYKGLLGDGSDDSELKRAWSDRFEKASVEWMAREGCPRPKPPRDGFSLRLTH